MRWRGFRVLVVLWGVLRLGAAWSKPLDLEKMVLGPQDLPPNVALVLMGGKVDKAACLRKKARDPSLREVDCDQKVSLPNPYFYVDPVQKDSNSKNLYPGVIPATLANGVVTFYAHPSHTGYLGYVLLNYKDKTPADRLAYPREWEKVNKAAKRAGGPAYTRVYQKGPQGFFVFREKLPNPRHEAPRVLMDQIYKTLASRLGGGPGAAPPPPSALVLGLLPQRGLPGGLRLAAAPPGGGNPTLLAGPAAQRLVARLLPQTAFEQVKGVRLALYDGAGDTCRLSLVSVLFRSDRGQAEAFRAVDYLQKNLLSTPGARLYYGARTLHHLGQTGCGAAAAELGALDRQFVKLNPGFKRLTLSQEKGAAALAEEVKAFVKKLSACVNAANQSCVAGLLSDGKAVEKLLAQNRNAQMMKKELEHLMKRQGSTGAVLRDLLLAQKSSKTAVFQPVVWGKLNVKAPLKTPGLSLYVVDHQGLPLLKTGTVRVAHVLAGKFRALPREGGAFRLTVRRLVLERTPRGLFLVAWE